MPDTTQSSTVRETLDPDPLRSALERATAGRYTVMRELGRGGMGAVYLAQDITLDRPVAIKVLPPELAVQPALRERFVREARLAASLSHPNIVHVHAVEEHSDVLAFVMQYVDGESLTERVIRSGPYDPQDLATLLQDSAWALGYAHGRGIVHRDVKPDNVMIERGTGRALLMDFGIARTARATPLTEVGHSIGTPHYMSPEQAAAEPVDGRSDLYSLACVGFFAATGRPPFDGDTAHRVLIQHLTANAPLIGTIRPGFPVGLERVIAQALEKEPASRFASGEVMAEAIGALQLRSQEVAPLLRLFGQQTAQSLQALLLTCATFAAFWMFSSLQRTLIGTLVAVMFLSIAATIVVHALDRVRFTVRQGFTANDVRAAIAAINDETSRAREQLMSDPVERARSVRRRRLGALGGGVAGPLLIVLVRAILGRDALAASINTRTALVLLVATIVTGVSVVAGTLRPIRLTWTQRAANRLLVGPLGRWLFARAERRYTRDRSRAAALG